MNKERILAMLKDKKVQNYSYHIFFFLAFSFFVIFAIQPNLSTAFRLQKELQDLRLENKKSEEVILQIVNYQSLMEEYRESLYVLDDAVPSTPELSFAIEDISKIASASGLIVQSMTVESISLKGDTSSAPLGGQDGSSSEVQNGVLGLNTEINDQGTADVSPSSEGVVSPSSKPDLLSFTVSVEGKASMEQIAEFLKQIINQRRLKTYDTIGIVSNTEGTSTIINILIRTYYL